MNLILKNISKKQKEIIDDAIPKLREAFVRFKFLVKNLVELEALLNPIESRLISLGDAEYIKVHPIVDNETLSYKFRKEFWEQFNLGPEFEVDYYLDF